MAISSEPKPGPLARHPEGAIQPGDPSGSPGGGSGLKSVKNLDPMLTETQAAAYLGYQPRTLAAWRYKGGGPVFVCVSRTSIRYRRSDLEAWIEERRRRSTSDPGPSRPTSQPCR